MKLFALFLFKYILHKVWGQIQKKKKEMYTFIQQELHFKIY